MRIRTIAKADHAWPGGPMEAMLCANHLQDAAPCRHDPGPASGRHRHLRFVRGGLQGVVKDLIVPRSQAELPGNHVFPKRIPGVDLFSNACKHGTSTIVEGSLANRGGLLGWLIVSGKCTGSALDGTPT